LKISRGTIFGRDYSTHTKPPYEWRDDRGVTGGLPVAP